MPVPSLRTVVACVGILLAGTSSSGTSPVQAGTTDLLNPAAAVSDAPADTVEVTIGPRETIRQPHEMPFVMDASLATLRRDAASWYFYHSVDWGKSNAKFLGTVANPFEAKVWHKSRDELYDLNGWYADVHHAGLWLMNLYQVRDGELLGIVHIELHYQAPGVNQGEDYAMGIVHSTDGGDRWTFCGEIIRPHNSQRNIGGSPLLAVGDYFHVYFNDHGPDGRRLAVARARIGEVVEAAREHQITAWRKYRDGVWNEDGLTGLGSAVLPGNGGGGGHPADLHADAAYNRDVDRYMITRWRYEDGVGRLYLHLSRDGVHFETQYLVDEEPGQWMPYSTFLADQSDQETNDMSSVGAAFYLLINHKSAANYAIDSLHRRKITLSTQ